MGNMKNRDGKTAKWLSQISVTSVAKCLERGQCQIEALDDPDRIRVCERRCFILISLRHRPPGKLYGVLLA